MTAAFPTFDGPASGAARKPHVLVDDRDVIAWVQAKGVATVQQVADAFNIWTGTARRKLDGGCARGELVRDEYDAAGARLHHLDYRYCERWDGEAA